MDPPAQKEPVSIKRISPSQLKQIKQNWQKSLVLKNENARQDKAAPKDAKYYSDRNTRVEKETRARKSQALPQKGESTPKSLDLSKFGLNLTEGIKISKKSVQQKIDQALSPNALPLGAENLLNTEKSIYYSYYSRLYEAIAPIWQSKIKEIIRAQKFVPAIYVTKADIVFNKKGQVTDIIFKKKSGVPQFDQVVVDSWKKVSRVMNPPKSLLSEDGKVTTSWTFNVNLQDTGPFFELKYPKQIPTKAP